MKGLLSLLITLLLSITCYSQPNSGFTPFKILELSLSTQPLEVHKKQSAEIIKLAIGLAREKGIELPSYQLTLQDLASLPVSKQDFLNIDLLKEMSHKPLLRKTFFQTLYLQNIHTPSAEINQFHKSQFGGLSSLQKNLYSKAGKTLEMDNLVRAAQELRKVVFAPENFKSIPIYDGFEFINKNKIPESMPKLSKLLNDSSLLMSELDDLAQEKLFSISDYSEITSFEEYKEYIDSSKLSIGGEKHSLGKAKKTFINVKTKNGYKPLMISKVVLHDSEDAFIYVPDELDINEPNFQNYILKQHSKAATTYTGFKDIKILQDENITKNPITALLDLSYDNPHAAHRMKKNIEYWKASFKKVTLSGRNLYIIKKSGEVVYSPKPKLFSSEYWKSGKAYKKFKRIIFSKAENWPFAFVWGAINTGIAYGASVWTGGSPKEALVFASTIALFSTTFTAHVGTLQNATKGFTPFLNKFHNLLITSVTFASVFLLGKYVILDDPHATLNIFGKNSLAAFQNFYDVLVIGIVSKHFSETWKIGTDIIKETRALRGNSKILGFIKFGKFQLLYQALQLARGTFKNVILMMALGGASASIGGLELPAITLGEFALLKPSMWFLPITSVVGAVASVGLIKSMKLLNRSPKARLIMERNAIVNKTYKAIEKVSSSINTASRKIKISCNRLFGIKAN